MRGALSAAKVVSSWTGVIFGSVQLWTIMHSRGPRPIHVILMSWAFSLSALEPKQDRIGAVMTCS